VDALCGRDREGERPGEDEVSIRTGRRDAEKWEK